MLTQNFGGQAKGIMVFLEVAYWKQELELPDDHDKGILTFSSGKLSFILTIAAENSAYRRVIWKRKIPLMDSFHSDHNDSIKNATNLNI